MSKTMKIAPAPAPPTSAVKEMYSYWQDIGAYDIHDELCVSDDFVLERMGHIDRELERLRQENERLRSIVKAIAENDLDDMASDCHTVGMVIQQQAKEALNDTE